MVNVIRVLEKSCERGKSAKRGSVSSEDKFA